jgi:hypothetical protein
MGMDSKWTSKMKEVKTAAEWFEELDRLNSEPFLPRQSATRNAKEGDLR